MREEEKFGIWIAGATLRAGQHEIDALALDDLARQAQNSGDLDRQLAEMRRFDRKGGDFGAEIVGAILIPILIEAGKQLWAAYVKKLADKAAGALADATSDGVAELVKRHWHGSTDDAAQEFASIIRDVGARHKLPQAQVDELIAALQSPAMAKELGAA